MSFYDQLASVTRLEDALDPARYHPAPADWRLAITDIEGSTAAIERGQHKAVNMIAAACIAAARNACPGSELPYLFGGDGATVLVPPEQAGLAFAALAGVQAAARAEGLILRAGTMSVGDLRARGHDVLVARYEASPGNAFAMFRGGGVGFLDQVIKGRHPTVPASATALPEGSADPDLSGLSCRWEPIASRGGCVVSLVVVMQGGDDDYRPVLRRIQEITGGDAQPILPATLEAELRKRWFPSAAAIETEIDAAEAKERRGRWRRRIQILMGTLVLQVSLRLGIRLGRLDTRRYLAETARNSDFCKIDGALQMVIDCTPDALARIEAFLMELEGAGLIAFGLHVSDSALMTCLVESVTENRHVHFIDGAGGGYTRAAKAMKEKVARWATAPLVPGA